jgi:hypothetical protein
MTDFGTQGDPRWYDRVSLEPQHLPPRKSWFRRIWEAIPRLFKARS